MNAFDGDDVPLPLDYGVPVDTLSRRKKPVSFTPPEYTLAGTSMASENVIECGQCGSLLKESAAYLHSHWHERNAAPRVVL